MRLGNPILVLLLLLRLPLSLILRTATFGTSLGTAMTMFVGLLKKVCLLLHTGAS